jgi:cellulose synthase/poly-beta-1,6-N-acetylglucosamine synthase-like glycosyltransferase
MVHTVEWIALFSVGAVVYSYLLYPLTLIALAGIAQTTRDVRYALKKHDSRPMNSAVLPHVAVVIAAYNEERFIKQRVENLLACDYPAERLSVYVGSDGSKDKTVEILSGFSDPRVHAFPFLENRGKASVLNELLSKVTEPIVVFSDANTFFEHNAIKKLVRHFDDQAVGAVSGELRLVSKGGDNQDSLYWKIEQLLKFFEARIGGLLGANGAIYAIRRSLWIPLEPDTICDDFCVAMSIAAKKHVLVYDPSAFATEDIPEVISEEYHRRVRIGIGNFQALVRHPEYIFSVNWATKFSYISHKVLRWLSPHLLAVSIVGSLLIAGLDRNPLWLAFGLAEVFAVVVGLVFYRMSARGARLNSIFKILAFAFALNWAFVVASWRFASGNYRGSWRRTAR